MIHLEKKFTKIFCSEITLTQQHLTMRFGKDKLINCFSNNQYSSQIISRIYQVRYFTRKNLNKRNKCLKIFERKFKAKL
jgi:hypothetical protein